MATKRELETAAALIAVATDQDGRYIQRAINSGVAVDVYDSPRGRGYILRMETETEVKRIATGPDADIFSHDWRTKPEIER